MKKIRIRFEQACAEAEIEVLIRASERDAQVDALMERVSGQPPDALTATDGEGALVRLAPEKIILISVRGNHTRIETEQGVYTLRQTLQSIERILDDRRFLRISRSELVNMDKVEKFDFTIQGALRLELTGGIETWASRRCIPAVRKRIKGKE